MQIPETNNEHNGVNGYVYESTACLACHPTGDSDTAFDHDNTNFPLTGEHIGVACLDCHADGFAGTSTACVDCHQMDFNGSVNPNHTELNLPTDCVSCHTTDADWKPASFDIHNEYYPLNGAHAAIANDCATCHNGDYNNTPNTCVGCHQTDFDNTTNPNHSQVGFSTDCASCHNEQNWSEANFDHDNQYFPIYSGEHDGEWSDCVDCHTNPNNFAEFTCTTCHANPETNNEHNGVNGYVYESTACLACHPTGDSNTAFDHDNTNFPLTGEHIGVACLDCHADGFAGTSTALWIVTKWILMEQNPNHTLGLSTDCATCHTTDADWMPASFAVHDDFYP
ncbi:MAG: cytochrome c3 family protein [Chitinophagales bacterium]